MRVIYLDIKSVWAIPEKKKRVPVPATIFLKFAVPLVFKIRISKVYWLFYMQMPHLGHSKFFQINVKD